MITIKRLKRRTKVGTMDRNRADGGCQKRLWWRDGGPENDKSATRLTDYITSPGAPVAAIGRQRIVQRAFRRSRSPIPTDRDPSRTPSSSVQGQRGRIVLEVGANETGVRGPFNQPDGNFAERENSGLIPDQGAAKQLGLRSISSRRGELPETLIRKPSSCCNLAASFMKSVH